MTRLKTNVARIGHMNTPDSAILALLAYRLEAISIGQFALRHQITWDEAPTMEVYFNGKQVIEGKATGFTNGAIESAIIHCRAILEFLGFKADKGSSTRIAERSRRTITDDVGVECFAGLSMLKKAKALAAYPGEKAEAEAALALIFHSANKGLAHTTVSFIPHSSDARLLVIAFRGIPKLLINGFYVPLGIDPPSYELPSRPIIA